MATATVTLTAVLATASGPVGSEPVDFQWSPAGMNTWTDLLTSTTDATGKATKTVTLTVGTKYDFKANFAGDATLGLNASSGTVSSFQVTQDTTIQLSVVSH